MTLGRGLETAFEEAEKALNPLLSPVKGGANRV